MWIDFESLTPDEDGRVDLYIHFVEETPTFRKTNVHYVLDLSSLVLAD